MYPAICAVYVYVKTRLILDSIYIYIYILAFRPRLLPMYWSNEISCLFFSSHKSWNETAHSWSPTNRNSRLAQARGDAYRISSLYISSPMHLRYIVSVSSENCAVSRYHIVSRVARYIAGYDMICTVSGQPVVRVRCMKSVTRPVHRSPSHVMWHREKTVDHGINRGQRTYRGQGTGGALEKRELYGSIRFSQRYWDHIYRGAMTLKKPFFFQGEFPTYRIRYHVDIAIFFLMIGMFNWNYAEECSKQRAWSIQSAGIDGRTHFHVQQCVCRTPTWRVLMNYLPLHDRVEGFY